MGVEFNENKVADYNYQPQKGGLTPLFIKMGLAKDESGAKKIMVVIIIICFAIAIYFAI